MAERQGGGREASPAAAGQGQVRGGAQARCRGGGGEKRRSLRGILKADWQDLSRDHVRGMQRYEMERSGVTLGSLARATGSVTFSVNEPGKGWRGMGFGGVDENGVLRKATSQGDLIVNS